MTSTSSVATNDIKTVEDKFINSLGSGVGAAKQLSEMIKSVSSSRDTTVLARSIFRSEKKGDLAAASIVRFVTGQVWPKAKVQKVKDGVPKITIKGIEHNQEAINRLVGAVEKNLSIRHTTFRKVVKGDTDTEPKTFDPKAWAERQAKSHKDSLDAMIAALQAMRSA